jgi:hypothetical protein
VPNGNTIGITNVRKIYQHFQFQGTSKYNKIGIFGMRNTPSGNPGGKCCQNIKFTAR